MAIGILLLRITVGLTLAAHGAQKLFGWFGGPGIDGTAGFMETLGFRPGRRHAVLAGLAEVGGGLLFAVGLATPLAAAIIASVMLVAALSVHRTKSFFLANGGYEFNLVLGMAALSVAFLSPGTASIDALIGYSEGGVAWGIGAAALAALGAVIPLGQRRMSHSHQPAKAA